MASARATVWLSPVPDSCEICTEAITDVFVDGRVKSVGSWAIMCMKCHREHGVGFGIGLGQLYRKQADGRFVKAA